MAQINVEVAARRVDEGLEGTPLELVVRELHLDAKWQQDAAVVDAVLDAGPPETDVDVLSTGGWVSRPGQVQQTTTGVALALSQDTPGSPRTT